MPDLSTRVRERLRDEMTRQHLSQREVAAMLKWSQSRIARALTGRTSIALDDLEGLCFALSLPVSEAVRDRGLEFYAEMTPTEVRILEQLRDLSKTHPLSYEAFLTLLNVRQSPTAERYAKKPGAQPRRK